MWMHIAQTAATFGSTEPYWHNPFVSTACTDN